MKATPQTHAEVGDRANDAIRVNGKELRCKVVAEGGNLGFTQLGRVEYAFNGGKINTDAIDNSAGVDCSDHEVNIKILLNSVVAEGRMSGEQRNNLLAEMTDEVGALVLRDNYLQTQSLSVRERMLLDAQTRFISTWRRPVSSPAQSNFCRPMKSWLRARRRRLALLRRSARCCLPTAKSCFMTRCLLPKCRTIRTSPPRWCASSLRRLASAIAIKWSVTRSSVKSSRRRSLTT